jgi:subtilisin family serine protease
MKKKVLLTTLVIAILIISYAFVSQARNDTNQLIEQMTASPKLIESDLVLENFRAGRETTRVIVTLKEPTGFQHSIEMDMNRTAQLRLTEKSHEDGHIKDPVFRGRLQSKVDEVQDAVIRSLDPRRVRITNRFKYIFGFSAEVTLEGLKELEVLNEVISISKDAVHHEHLAQGIPLMNAATVRSTHDGSGIAIAICDTGIDTSHPALGNGGSPIFNSKVIGGYDTGDDDSDPRPNATIGNAHGTACAGIAAGDIGSVGDYIGGVAPNAKLYALKISTGDSGSAWTSDIIEAWEWCVTHQYDDPNNPIMIISTSFGGSHYTSPCDSVEPAHAAAAANAVAAGITLFASAGNDGFCDAIERSACVSYVNAVGAVYDANIGKYPPDPYVGCISSLSCVGNLAPPCSEKWYKDATTAADQVTTYSNSATFMDLFAPSNYAYTTDIVGSGGYASGDYTSSFGGTSAACPYAAGAAASLQSAAQAVGGSFLSPSLVRFILTSTGDLVTDPKASPTVTKPRVNLQAAADFISGLSGVILDSNGSPMSGVKVSCEGDNWWTSTTTNPNGSFELAVAAGGMQCAVEPQVSSGHAWYIHYYYLDPGEVRDLGNIQLEKGALVTGHIYYDDGTTPGTPVDMVEYWVAGRFDAVWGESDFSGYFEFRLPLGSYNLNLGEDQGYFMVPVQIDVTDVNATYDLDNIPASRPNRKFYDSSSSVDLISGNVSDNSLAYNGEFIVVSFLNDQQFTTDNIGGTAPLGANYPDAATGDYVFFVPPTGDYDRDGRNVFVLLILSTDEVEGNESITVVDAVRDLGTPSSGINLSYDSEGQTVQGYVKDRASSEGIFFASLVLYKQPGDELAGFAETDHNGKYIFYNVQPATYRLAAVAQGYPEPKWSSNFDVSSRDITVSDIFMSTGAGVAALPGILHLLLGN